MSSPSPSPVQELCRLARSSPDFSDQLYNILCREEFMQCEKELEHDDLVQVIDYLDEVRGYFAFPTFRHST